VRIGSHAEPRESTSGPFPNIGTFRVFCHFSHQNYDDPLVFPGVVNATHLHSFFGNKNTKASSTASSIRGGGNSTCQGGTADRSAYWIPSVYDATAKKLVRPTFAAVYYQSGFGNWVDPAAIQPIPTGLMILAGRASATPGNAISQQVGYWGCFNNGAPTNTGNVIPTCPSGHSVTMIVNFPQCWNGSNLDSANHASHMAYPSWQGCPASHPVVIPRIMLQVIFPQESHGTGGWSLTSDNYPITERGGASIHADFVNGWDTGIMDRWLENCIRAVKDCERSELGGGQALTFSFGGASAPPITLTSGPAGDTRSGQSGDHHRPHRLQHLLRHDRTHLQLVRQLRNPELEVEADHQRVFRCDREAGALVHAW